MQAATLDAIVTGLRELGYTEGQNIAIEREFGEANADRLRELAAELVKRRVNLIVAAGGFPRSCHAVHPANM